MHILIDHREKSSGLVEHLRDDFEIEMGHLFCGDYLINKRILVERKTARDMALSIIDTRLFRQARKLKNSSYRSVLLVEGDPFQTDLDISKNAMRGALLSIGGIWQLPVIFSKSPEETRDTLVSLGNQDMKYCDVLLLRGGYRPRRLQTRQLYLLQGLPYVGPVLAKRLLEHLGTPFEVMNASPEELSAVKGIGPEKARVIREVLDS
jgi:DNA excision repair protein ERCC-4